MSQLFMQGKLAMMVSGRWSVPVFRSQAKFDWDIAPFPKGSAGSIVGIDSSGYAISKTTRFPQEAWSFIAFLSSTKAQTALAESGLIVPARQDVAHSQAFLQSPPQHSKTFIDIIEYGNPTHVPVRWNEIAEELGLALEPVFEGTRTAEEALKKVQPKIQILLEES
jgi:multiple sugar transport system substrate-binding protein